MENWLDWHWQLRNCLKSKDDFANQFSLSAQEIEGFKSIQEIFRVQVTPYYASLADKQNQFDPIRLMFMPHAEEANPQAHAVVDPLGEFKNQPVKRIIHRYPDRLLFWLTDTCSVYCRFCLRKHFTASDEGFIKNTDYEEAISYIKANTNVREVIFSGGDPLTLSDNLLDRAMSDIRKIPHVEIIRIASRMPVVCPMRITSDLVKILRKHSPVFFMTHFNHPNELTALAQEALSLLVDGGIPIMNQMVILKGINNNAETIENLGRALLRSRVKPYYMFQCDPSRGTDHLRTSVEESLQLQKQLWGRVSGLALGQLSLDIPGGGGKVGFTPDYLISRTDNEWHFRGWDGIHGMYQDP